MPWCVCACVVIIVIYLFLYFSLFLSRSLSLLARVYGVRCLLPISFDCSLFAWFLSLRSLHAHTSRPYVYEHLDRQLTHSFDFHVTHWTRWIGIKREKKTHAKFCGKLTNTFNRGQHISRRSRWHFHWPPKIYINTMNIMHEEKKHGEFFFALSKLLSLIVGWNRWAPLCCSKPFDQVTFNQLFDFFRLFRPLHHFDSIPRFFSPSSVAIKYREIKCSFKLPYVLEFRFFFSRLLRMATIWLINFLFRVWTFRHLIGNAKEKKETEKLESVPPPPTKQIPTINTTQQQQSEKKVRICCVLRVQNV